MDIPKYLVIDPLIFIQDENECNKVVIFNYRESYKELLKYNVFSYIFIDLFEISNISRELCDPQRLLNALSSPINEVILSEGKLLFEKLDFVKEKQVIPTVFTSSAKEREIRIMGSAYVRIISKYSVNIFKLVSIVSLIDDTLALMMNDANPLYIHEIFSECNKRGIGVNVINKTINNTFKTFDDVAKYDVKVRQTLE